MEDNYVIILDIGTTTIRSFIFNSRAETIATASDQVVLHYPCSGFVEIDPDELWVSIVAVINNTLRSANLSAGQMQAMGISVQRSTFTTWSRSTGKPFHRFITWKDLRADKLVKQWNNSYCWKFIRMVCYTLYLVSGSKRFKAGSVLKFMNTQTTMRLLWALQNIEPLKEATKINDAMFGTLDTWLLYKLTDHKIHMTDVSSASATGFFDPFTMRWAGWAINLLGLPVNSLPTVVDTAGPHFTSTAASVWGHPIPILSCMADQTASMWGSCCFDVGDVKLTMGTGTFLDINTGSTPHASVSGLYPVVGWRLGEELVYAAEGANSDTASIIQWANKLGLFDDPKDTADIALSVPDSDDVYFIPAFSGLGPPYNDGSAASGFVGIQPSTTKAHLVRAVLESLAFRTAQLYHCVRAETTIPFNCIRLDGGVSNNDFIAQLVADLTGLRVERPVHVEMASFGCALIVGLQLGYWKSKGELKLLREVGTVFHPRPQVKKEYDATFARWQDAAKRMCGWYSESKSSRSSNSLPSSSSSSSQTSYTRLLKNGRKKVA